MIFEHGITRDRSDAFALAQAFASQGWVIAAVDLPLHGITDTAERRSTRPPNEQTFNLDLIVNATGASGPDGVIDPTGTHFINLPYPLASRDNLRQGVVNLLALTRALPNARPRRRCGRRHRSGAHRLRRPVAGLHRGHQFRRGVADADEFPAPAQLRCACRPWCSRCRAAASPSLLRDSPTFGPRINAGLQGQGLLPGTSLYAQYFRDVQNIVDAGDPLNFMTRGRGPAVYLLPADGGRRHSAWRHGRGLARPGDPELRHRSA